jgi:Protein of unknown function (DUF2817)
MDGDDYFSGDYRTARARFRAAANRRGWVGEAFPLAANTPDLTVDAAVLGTESPTRLVLITSGLHGVEGFFGSAVQAALLEDELGDWRPPAGAAIVFLHALCPFGFDQIRRANEGNVDLNRNFLKSGEWFTGSPPGYPSLDPFINPPRPPRSWDLFGPRLYLTGLIRGQRFIRQAIAGGQYEFPRGLFYGGDKPAATQRILAEQLPRWTDSAERIIHVDFHTGLGPWATYKILTAHGEADAATRILRDWFGPAVEACRTGPTAYDSRGGIDDWLQARFADRECFSVCAEFGTYGPLAVLSALRAENQAHHWGQNDPVSVHRAKRRLCEVFAPASRGWRQSVVRQGVEVVRQAIDGCFTK